MFWGRGLGKPFLQEGFPQIFLQMLLVCDLVDVLVQHARDECLVRQSFFEGFFLKTDEVPFRHADVDAFVFS